MVATESRPELVGQPIKRREDPRLIQGQGRFLDDIVLPNMTHAAILRSPHAHAHIVSVDTSAAATMPGVVGVFTGRDMLDINPLPFAFPAAGVENFINTPRALAVDEVHWTGDPVAVVVAESVREAYDALEAIDVQYDVLPAVVDAELTTFDGAPQLHENAPNNVVFRWTCGNQAGTDDALSAAEVRISQRVRNQRLIPTALETRGAIAQYDPGREDYTLWLSSQAPHVHRLVMAAFVLGIP
jgi:carbon-monoxide dehydrogenase large subunit